MSDTLTEAPRPPRRTPASSTACTARGEPIADTKAPQVDIKDRWTTRQFEAALVNPANRRKLTVIVVGTGLAGGAACATLGEAGYHVKSFCYQDSPRRAHSIAARAASTRRRTTRRTATPSTGCSTTRSRAATSARARATSTGSPRSAPTSSTSASRRASPSRGGVRRPARQPLVRRRPGLAHLLRAWPDGPAAAHRRLPGARAADRGRHGAHVHPPRDARARRRRRPARAASSPATSSPARSRRTWPTRSCWPAAATATSSSSPPTR